MNPTTLREFAIRWRLTADGQLMKNDEAVLLLGGQTHNSSSSSTAAIERSFAHARRMNTNTVLAPVSWAQFEPVEGSYRFELIDAMLEQARANSLWLVPLWFGAFKNAASTYAPRWVRADPTRFPRATIDAKGLQAYTYAGATAKPVLSVFSDELRDADARAFEALVRHIEEHDDAGTVAMVQVENESGLLSDSRDRSVVAGEKWAAPVPAELVAWLQSDASANTAPHSVWVENGASGVGSWTELFGDGWQGDEIFMTWGFASYVEHLASRGKGVSSLPLYTNAWLGPQPGQSEAGQYPSGGPGTRVLDLWRLAAPSLDLIGPDIYVQDFEVPMRDYSAGGSPLFIPECRPTAAALVRAIGAYGAIGWSVFGIDDGNPSGQVAGVLGFTTALHREIADAQSAGLVAAVVLEAGTTELSVRLGDVDVMVRDSRALFERMLLDIGVQLPIGERTVPDETLDGAAIPQPGESRPFGLLYSDKRGVITVIGQGLTVDFFVEGRRVEIDEVEEGKVSGGKYVPGRVLNGDERLRLLPVEEVGAARFKLLYI